MTQDFKFGASMITIVVVVLAILIALSSQGCEDSHSINIINPKVDTLLVAETLFVTDTVYVCMECDDDCDDRHGDHEHNGQGQGHDCGDD